MIQNNIILDYRLFTQIYGKNGDRTSCFEILGIPDSSSQDEIKKAYLKLARKCHPDKNPNQSEEDSNNFLKILKAFETLTGKRLVEIRKINLSQWKSTSLVMDRTLTLESEINVRRVWNKRRGGKIL